MKKRFFQIAIPVVIACLSLFLIAAHWEVTGNVSTEVDGELINVVDTYTSAVNGLSRSKFLGVHYIATSVAGAPLIDITYELSSTETAGEFVQPEGGGVIVDNLDTEVWHVDAIACPPMAYIRFVVTGEAGNAADTLVTMRVFWQ